MADDITPGTVEAGQGGAPNTEQKPEFDYKQGYENLQPEYTRSRQELSEASARLSEYEQLFEALQDPESRGAALDALGFELDTGSALTPQQQEDEFIDPLEQRLDAAEKRVQELEQARELEANEAESQRVIQMRDELIGEEITYIEEMTHQKFTEHEDEVLGNLAISMADEDGVPDVRGAYEALYGEKGVLETRREQWIASKQNAGRVPNGATTPTEKPDLSTPSKRVEYFDERLRAAQQNW